MLYYDRTEVSEGIEQVNQNNVNQNICHYW